MEYDLGTQWLKLILGTSRIGYVGGDFDISFQPDFDTVSQLWFECNPKSLYVCCWIGWIILLAYAWHGNRKELLKNQSVPRWSSSGFSDYGLSTSFSDVQKSGLIRFKWTGRRERGPVPSRDIWKRLKRKAVKSWYYCVLVCLYYSTRIWKTYERRLAKILKISSVHNLHNLYKL